MRGLRRFLTAVGIALAIVVALPALFLVGHRVWIGITMRQKLHQAEGKAVIDQIIAALGPPYAVYGVNEAHGASPKLGAHLVDIDDMVAGKVKVYAFWVTKLPPTFVVVAVESASGKVLRIGSDTS